MIRAREREALSAGFEAFQNYRKQCNDTMCDLVGQKMSTTPSPWNELGDVCDLTEIQLRYLTATKAETAQQAKSKSLSESAIV